MEIATRVPVLPEAFFRDTIPGPKRAQTRCLQGLQGFFARGDCGVETAAGWADCAPPAYPFGLRSYPFG